MATKLTPAMQAVVEAMIGGEPLIFWQIHYREHIHGWSIGQKRVNGNACLGLLSRGLIEDYDNQDYAHTWYYRLTSAGRAAAGEARDAP